MNEAYYTRLVEKQRAGRDLFGRPMTLAEKILFAHLHSIPGKAPARGKDYTAVDPDRVAMQDATAQMALLQFMLARREASAVPVSVHCDHLVRACRGAREDLDAALQENGEVYGFLETAARRYGMDFWKPGAGIIHQIVLEEYAFPGGLMIGADSHTPNAGGLGMMAVGVGGADAVDVMIGSAWELGWPHMIGVRLSGCLSGWTSPKDVILELAGILSVKGATGCVIEYFGEGAATLSATGKATICNMGAEVGATCSLFPYDDRMSQFLRATGRQETAWQADRAAEALGADEAVLEDPGNFFDHVIEMDLSRLEPHLNGPHSPGTARPVSALKQAVREEGFPDRVSAALIGSCTGASYEDMDRAASVARQAAEKGLRARAGLYISPGSERVRATLERDGQLAALEAVGGVILANACGPCIGMWERTGDGAGERNTIVTSYNRNFPGRNDGNHETLAFVASPEIVTALALSGSLSFDPSRDELAGGRGERVRLAPPTGKQLPGSFASCDPGLSRGEPDASVEVRIREGSERIQCLERFPEWDGKDVEGAPVLIKVQGPCTTDQISPAGKWLRYRGHLDNISRNLFAGARNVFTGEVGTARDVFTGRTGAVHEVARAYKARGTGWVAVGDENYGEGSSREHAAMEPRWLGGRAVIAKSFARIHETNLKRQGVLALTFADPGDYERISEGDRLTICLGGFAPGRPLHAVAGHADGTGEEFTLRHSYSESQTQWFRAGAALNAIEVSPEG